VTQYVAHGNFRACEDFAALPTAGKELFLAGFWLATTLNDRGSGRKMLSKSVIHLPTSGTLINIDHVVISRCINNFRETTVAEGMRASR